MSHVMYVLSVFVEFVSNFVSVVVDKMALQLPPVHIFSATVPSGAIACSYG